VASGALSATDGLWSWSGPLQAPPRLVELLAERLADLDAPSRRALALLALGEPLTWEQLEALDAAAVTEALVAEGLVLGDAPRASLAHPLLGDVALAGVTAPARRRLLGELAAVTDPVEEPLRAALWLSDSGAEVDAELLVRASRACLFIDAPLGERLARAALSPGAHDVLGASPRMEAARLLAQHAMISGHARDADAVLETVDDGSLSLTERVQVAVSRANLLTWGLGRPDDALDLLDRGSSIGAAAGRELTAHAVPMFMFGGRVAEAVRSYEALWADPAVSPVQRLRAALGAVPALVAAGRPVRALAVAGEALSLVPQCTDELPVALPQLAAGITLAQVLSGDLDAAESLIRPAYDEGVARNIPLLRGGAAMRLGQIALWRGQPVTAAALVREAVLALQQADAGLLAWASDTLRLACAMVGDQEGIDAGARAGSVALRFPVFVTEMHRADAAVAAARGEVSRARQALMTGLTEAERAGQDIQTTVLAFELARYGDAAEAARRVPAGVEGVLAEMMRDAIAALAARKGDRLLGVSEALEARGYRLFAAELARAAARAFGAAGRQDPERRADTRADALAAGCEGARTPLLEDRPATTRLTGREREVAVLAAAGATDAEIARRLGLSVRTVETHLHRAYAKVGAEGRGDLAKLLG
jgi:DNA-binding CsgD family transcriptional regulator